MTKEPSVNQPVDIKAIYERVKAKKRDPKDDNSMREKCECGFDKWRFRYCEKLECEGHWICRNCGKAFKEKKE